MRTFQNIILTIVFLVGLKLTAQTIVSLKRFDFRSAFVVGEITNLPDTIIICEKL
jgi:hypothetical protein